MLPVDMQTFTESKQVLAAINAASNYDEQIDIAYSAADRAELAIDSSVNPGLSGVYYMADGAVLFDRCGVWHVEFPVELSSI